MSARRRSLAGRPAHTRRRARIVALPVVLLATLAAGFALAPTPPIRRPDRPAARTPLLPPTANNPATSRRPNGLPTQVTPRESGSERPSPAGRGRSLREVGDPERPPSPASSPGAMLAAARQFALAYMPYQVGRLPRWARATITRACTPMLAHPARQTPLQTAHPNVVETYRVASVNLTAGPNRISVSYVSAQDPADTGAFLLILARRHGRWVIAGLDT